MPENPTTSSIPSPGHGTFRLSEDLAKLQEKAREQSLILGDVIFLLDDRAHTFLLLLLSLPFVQPIPLPGLSTPFGVAIALLGIGSLVGQKPWLPDRLLKMQLPDIFLAPALRVMRRLARIMEVLLRPENSFSGNQSHYATIGRSLYSRLRSSALFAIADPIFQHVARDDRDNFCVFDSREGRILLPRRHFLFCHHCGVFCRDRIRRHCNGGVGLRMARAEYVCRVRGRRNAVSARILG